jgi:hypothetical protein
MQTRPIVNIICAILISLGILGAGICIGKGFSVVKRMGRTITVKGLAERDVKSDLGIWEIDYREVGNNLTDLNQRIQHDQTQVKEFLKQHGFTDQEVEIQPVKVDDRLATLYSQSTGTPTMTADRYVVTSGLRVRSARVDLIQQVTQLTGNLLQQGIPIAFDSQIVTPNPSYYLTKLDAIRPGMLADATRSARLVAEQFAKDSDIQLRGIQRASQGIFQIMSRDTSTMSADWNTNQNLLGSVDKKVRLVTTIDYRIK